MITHCVWSTKDYSDLYKKYHDTEWGVPIHDDQKLFELLVLEGAQSGLPWITILRKREGYREAFDNFNPKKVALYDEKKYNELINNSKIVRNKLKIKHAIGNAKHFLEIQKEFGSFDKYLWAFVDNKQIQNAWKEARDVPEETDISNKLSSDLHKRGFKYVGPILIYAYMQAVGMVNDHLTSCFRHKETREKYG